MGGARTTRLPRTAVARLGPSVAWAAWLALFACPSLFAQYPVAAPGGWAVDNTRRAAASRLATPPGDSPSPRIHVDPAGVQVDLTDGTSRILTFDQRIARVLVENEEVLGVRGLEPTKLQIHARRPGVTQVNVWDERGNVMSVDVVIRGDARQLQASLRDAFPQVDVRVIPLQDGVVLTGRVPHAMLVPRVLQLAELSYPGRVINNLSVEGVQKVVLNVKLMEVSRTKLRALGFDWAELNGGDFVVQGLGDGVSGVLKALTPNNGTVTGTGGATVGFGIVNANNQFFGFLEALRRYDLLKVLAEPRLVAESGSPASFNVGGEFPIVVPQSLGTTTIQFRQYGTRVDFLPMVLSNGAVRLHVRSEVSELDPTRGVMLNNYQVPGIRNRSVDTAVELRPGQTLALAGLLQQQTEAQNRGVPVLADLPWVGAAFRRVTHQVNEVELLIMVTPEYADGLDPCDVPPFGPGQTTAAPSSYQLFSRGYLEVPLQGAPRGPIDGCFDSPAESEFEPAQSAFRQSEPRARGVASGQAHAMNPPALPAAASPDRLPPTAAPSARSANRLIGPFGYDIRR